jgi:photosystem II stability/assembly factor-like uncharacterized protein
MKNILILFVLVNCFNVSAQWMTLNSGTTEWLQGVDFPNLNTGFVVGYNGTILQTTDAGLSWNGLNSGTSNNLFSVFFINATTGWVCGANGMILKTTDAGTIWIPQNSSTGATLHEVFFLDANNGYITGDSGICLKTIDGGSTWTPLTLNTSNARVSLFFNSIDTGYVVGVGLSDAVMKTTDGGNSWTHLIPNSPVEFSSVYFSNDTGYAVTSNDMVIYATADGGSNWFAWSNTLQGGLFSIKFPSAQVGYTVGGFPNNSLIMHTSNAGVTWTQQTSSVPDPLFDVFFIDNNTGYAVGMNGAIIKTTNGTAVDITAPESLQEASIYPNPFQHQATLSMPASGTFEVRLYDLSGREIRTYSKVKNSLQIMQNELSSGIYSYQIFGQNLNQLTYTGKLIIID